MDGKRAGGNYRQFNYIIIIDDGDKNGADGQHRIG